MVELVKIYKSERVKAVNLQPLVSVIVPVYGTEKFLWQCLESVRNQTYGSFECLIIDDGSPDNSWAIASAFCRDDHRFLLVRQNNKGLSEARNRGMRLAKGELIAFLDSDDYWTPEKLERQVSASVEHVGKAVVYSKTSGVDEQGKEFPTFIETYQDRPVDLLKGNSIEGSGSSVLMPRWIVEEVGYFNADLRSFEDLEYWFRIATAGIRFVFVETPDVIITSRSGSLRGSKKGMRLANERAFQSQLRCIPATYSMADIHPAVMARLQRSRKYFDEGRLVQNVSYMMSLGLIYGRFLLFHGWRKLWGIGK